MNDDIMKGKWQQLRGDIRKRWGQLTDSDLDQVQGDREKLAGLLQERYGYAKEEASREVDEFLADQNTKGSSGYSGGGFGSTGMGGH